MRCRVENLGPLREAEVDLSKDLIVLTGPNNSGKTYLAWAVYGLFHFHPKLTNESIERLSEVLLASEDQRVRSPSLLAPEL
ncbi:AAA family ATPase [Sorangium sp. So ce590]|uniref:AAA family ATPase n=1 Tax=unclassified Sorangium TaxID=2621164 RepID=UPI003F5E3972